MPQRPRQFGVDIQIEPGRLLVGDLLGTESVEPHQPIGLIKPIFAHERGFVQRRQPLVVGIHRNKSRIVDALHRGTVIKRRRKQQNVAVALVGGTDDHLRALPRRSEAGRMAETAALLGALQHPLLDVTHRAVDAFIVLVGSQQQQVAFGRDFDIDAHAIGVTPRLGHQFGTGTGNTFQVDVAVETVHRPQVARHADHPFHGIVGVADDARREKQSFDVVAPVELDGQLGQLVRREGGPPDVVAAPVDAVGAVVNADVGEHDFQQRDAAAVGRERVAYAPPRRAAHIARTAAARDAARRARNVVFGRFGQHLEFFEHGLFHGGKLSFFSIKPLPPADIFSGFSAPRCMRGQ